MNQGARDANDESYRICQSSSQEEILSELKSIRALLVKIANNTSKDNSFMIECTPRS
jgi:hypothetical protein